MFIGIFMLFSLAGGLAMMFGGSVMKGHDKVRAFCILGGAILSIVPLIILIASFFYPVFD